MVGLALGVDYALLVVSRFREELEAGKEVEDAVEAGFDNVPHNPGAATMSERHALRPGGSGMRQEARHKVQGPAVRRACQLQTLTR